MVIMAPDRKASGGNSKNGDQKKGSKRSSQMNKESDEYKKRRERNNLAVKKSRSKSKMKTQETLERVNKLRAENEMLEAKIKLLSKELSFLKDLFLAHAGSAHGQSLQDIDTSIFTENEAESMSCEETKTVFSGDSDQDYVVKLIMKNENTT